MSSSSTASRRRSRRRTSCKEITVLSGHRRYSISISELNKYSIKIRKLAEQNRLPEKIDLTPYDENAVKTLIGYIRNYDQSDLQLSFYALSDLLDLARSLLIPGLLKQLEDTLIELASKKIDALVQALIIVGGDRAIAGGMSARRKIESIAAADFQKLIMHKLYGYIPPIIFGNIIARCDLNVQKEMDVVDAGILWLWQQRKRLFCTLVVFSRIRTAFLSRGDRETIRARLKTLYRGDKAIPLVMSLLSSTNCRRCCVIKDHIDKEMIRCGVPSASDDITVDLSRLPLSAPPGKIKEEKENSDASMRSSRAKKSKKGTTSQTTEKSEKSNKFVKKSKTKESKKSTKSSSSKAKRIDKIKSKLRRSKKKRKTKRNK